MTATTSVLQSLTAMTAEMTMLMMPGTMMGTRGRKRVKKYNRKDEFEEYSEGESRFGDGDYFLPNKFIPNLPSTAL